MAKRRRQKAKLKAKQRQQKERRPANRLAEAIELAGQNDFAAALPLAEAALSAANDEKTLAQASALTSSLYLHFADQASDLEARLGYLEAGEALAVDDAQARFAYHRGITLLALRRCAPALEALTRARQLGAAQESLALAIALAQQLGDQEPQSADLTPSEQQMLATLRGLQQGKIDAQAANAWAEQRPSSHETNLWQALLQMRESESASPLTTLVDASAALEINLADPLISYYTGVAALRRRDHDATVAAWNQAQAQGLDTPWFNENQDYLLRQEIEELAEHEEWAAIVERLVDHRALETNAPLKEHLAYAHFYLGEASARHERWAEAADHWRRTQELNPSRYVAQNLALAEESLENWDEAALAWRDLLRRRPRKENHPDYLDEMQVATLWKRAGDCYGRADEVDEQIACFSKAIEYAPEQVAWRMELVELYQEDMRTEAAINELQRILEIDENHLSALLLLASLFDEEWGRNSIPVWQRALAIDPANLDARDGLALAYAQQMEMGAFGPYAQMFRDRGLGIKAVERGLEEMADHPILLIEAGLYYLNNAKDKKARDFLLRAGDAALAHPLRYMRVFDTALHELLHVDGDREAERLLVEARKLPFLRMTFWVSQGTRVLSCELDPAWAERFWQEALTLAEQGRGGDTTALALAQIIDGAAGAVTHSEEAATAAAARNLLQKYADLAKQLAPNSGVVTYAEATVGTLDQPNTDKLKRLLRRAKRQAEKAGERGLVEHIEEVEMILSGPRSMLSSLLNLGGELPDLAGMPEMEELVKLFGEIDFDEDDF